MRIEDVEKLDWRQDSDYRAAERKMQRLAERETHARTRLAELETLVRESEKSLVQTRVAALLEESNDGLHGKIQQQLNAHRVEIAEMREELDAIKLAKEKFGPAVQEAAVQAKLRLGKTVLGPYTETAQGLRELLDRAIELNMLLDAIHARLMKEGVIRELYGRPELKSLTLPASFEILGVVNGSRHSSLQHWLSRHDNSFGAQ